MLIVAVVAPLLALGFASRSGSGGTVAAPLPAAPRPAFRVPQPTPLQDPAFLSRWSPVLRTTLARTAPSAGAGVETQLSTRTAEGTANIVLVLDGRAEDAAGDLWVEVRLPVLPVGSTGWVPRRDLGGYHLVRTHLVVDRARLRATLFSEGRPIFSAAIGIGKARWPTPAGEFYVRGRLRSLSPFYGPLAFGTSARSAVLTDWPAGGFVGIHGTNEPELLPGRVSHGCIRLTNEEILRLGRLLPVGTPLTIV